MNNRTSRRALLKTAALAAGAMTVGGSSPSTVLGANDRINLAIIGIRSRGHEHFGQWTKIPGVRIATLCDVDENLFASRVTEAEKLQGASPKTEKDLRRVFDDKDIDAVVVTTPNHWHALASVWAIQAGKDVYVEKPVSHSIAEGRAIVEAARTYRRIVQTGSQHRSNPLVRSAVEFVHSGGIGDPYMVKGVVYRPRESIGRGHTVEVPSGVNFDLWLGPAPLRPFIDNRFHYNWHWFWDTGDGETGNNGPHVMDVARWILKKNEHPRRVQSMGGLFAFDTDQETPNTQLSCLEYADGSLVQLEVRNLSTNLDGDVREGVIVYGSKGWVEIALGRSWASFLGQPNDPGPSMTHEQAEEKYTEITAGGAKADPHFVNFIDSLRARKPEMLAAPITEGHFSAAMCHLSNIAFRTGKTLTFDSKTESFPNDSDAQALATGFHRKPYTLPER